MEQRCPRLPTITMTHTMGHARARPAGYNLVPNVCAALRYIPGATESYPGHLRQLLKEKRARSFHPSLKKVVASLIFRLFLDKLIVTFVVHYA